MAKVIEKAVILEEESQKLEDAWYRYQSMLELINTGIDNDLVFARYEKSFATYNKIWSSLLTKYFTKDYANLGKEYSWNADFNTKEISITKN